MKKILAMALAVLMILSVVPMSALAATNGIPDDMTLVEDVKSTLAPGITQRKMVVYDKNNNRVEMFVAEADPSVDTVSIYANYKDNQNDVYGMQKTTDQAAAFEANHTDHNVVVAINASYYNTGTGKPTGAFVMEGNDVTNESEGNAYPFFARLKDGTYMIGAKNEYSTYKGQIQEAIGGYIHLVKDGAICSGLNSADKYPRQTVGITEDGRVILMTADGNQAPKSDGLTVYEQAQVMLAMGCVEALHLDGGGSATYCSKAEGSDTLEVVNSPSNGSERSVSNTLIFTSTAVADGTFDHATLSVDNAYITANATATVSAIGVDAAGGAAEIPEGVTYQLKDSASGSMSGNVFTPAKTGDAVIQMVYDGAVVGETTVYVVVPDGISFGREQLTVPYGVTVDVSLDVTYGVNEVKYTEADVTLALADADAGTLVGHKITAPAADAGITDTTMKATLVANTEVVASVAVKYGKGSEVIFDFEAGTASANMDNWIVRTHESKTAWNELGDARIVTADTGLVHDGNQALAFHTDFSQTTCSGANTTGYHALSLSWAGDAVSVKGAQSIGFWLYVPEDAMATEITVNTFYTDANGVIQRRTKDAFDDNGTLIYTPYWQDYMEESGWHYVAIDTSNFTDDLFIHDEPGYTGGAYKRNFFIKIYTVTGPDTLTFPAHHGDFTYYIDNITVDYSDAVADRELPVFGDVTAYGVFSDKTMSYGETTALTDNSLIFGANVSDNTTKANYVGLDAKSAKVYVDGNEVKATYSDGVITSDNVELADGYHRIKFEIADNNGNVKTIVREIEVTADSAKSTVELVPHDATLDRLLSGSVYWVDLTTDNLANLQSVTTTLNLNSINEFELEHMVVADGFDVSYKSTAAQDAENIVELTFTRNGEAVAADETVLASIPVRVWESKIHEYADHTSKTPEYMWTAGNIQFKQVIVTAEQGLAVFTNETNYFSGNIEVDHEAYTHYYNMDTTYHTEKGTYHVHTATALEDKDAACTEDGYTDRTYCEVCDSVVDWGTTIEATGHSYIVSNGKYVCETCGELKAQTGIYTDETGTYYLINGVAQSGWQIVGEDWYYFDSATKVGVDGALKIGPNTFEFTNGKLNSGVWAKTLFGTRYYYGPSYYYNGMQSINGKDYYFENGYRLEDGWQLTYDVGMNRIWYFFDENGVCDKDAVIEDGFYEDRKGYAYSKNGSALTGLKEIDGDYYYFDMFGYAVNNGTYAGRLFKDGYAAYTGIIEKDGVKYLYDDGITATCGLYEVDGEYYYSYWGGVLKTDGTYYITNSYCDLPSGEYTFDKDGKLANGLIDSDDATYFFINGKKASYGLYNIENEYYLVDWDGSIKTDGRFYVNATNCDLPALREYSFGADGKMLNGPVEIEGTTYLYVNGTTATCGLYEVDGEYYYSYWGGVLKTDGRYYITNSYCDLPGGKEYSFGADGKMYNGIEEINGTKYLYLNGTTATCGLYEVDGEYYYSYWGGVLKTDGRYYITNSYCDLSGGKEYSFGADGKMYNGIEEINGTKYLYLNGTTSLCGLYEVDGDYYYAYWGGVIKTDGQYYVTESYCDLPGGNYIFDEDGKMLNGIKEQDGKKYYYVNGRTATYGLTEIDGDYYLVNWGGEIKVDGTYYVSTSLCDLPAGRDYKFDSEGKMLNGFVTEEDGIHLYINGKSAPMGLIEVDGYYYFVKNGEGLIVTGTTYYAWETNGLSIEMNYKFDEMGRVIGE